MLVLARLLQQTDRDEETLEHLHHDLCEQRQPIALVRFDRRWADFFGRTVDETLFPEMIEPVAHVDIEIL